MHDVMQTEHPASLSPLRFTLSEWLTDTGVVGGLTTATALTALTVTWIISPRGSNSSSHMALLCVLTAMIAASRLFPIRIGKATRLYVASIPMYLLCSLYSPALAATAIGVGMLIRELSVCRECSNTSGTLATQVGRWVLIALVVSALASRIPVAYAAYAAALTAILMWGGDVLTCPLLFSPVTGKSPLAIIRVVGRQSCLGELMQYFVGMEALLLLQMGILWSGVLWVDIASTQLIILPMILLYLYLKAEDGTAAFS